MKRSDRGVERWGFWGDALSRTNVVRVGKVTHEKSEVIKKGKIVNVLFYYPVRYHSALKNLQGEGHGKIYNKCCGIAKKLFLSISF